MEESELIPERIAVSASQHRELLRIIDWPDTPTPKLDTLKDTKTPWTA